MYDNSLLHSHGEKDFLRNEQSNCEKLNDSIAIKTSPNHFGDDEDWLQISDEDDDGEFSDNEHCSVRPCRLSLNHCLGTEHNESYRFTESGSLLLNGFTIPIKKNGMHEGPHFPAKLSKTPLSMENRLVTLHKIGQGACGSVFKVLDIFTWRICAVKKIYIHDRVKRRQFAQELTALHDFDPKGENRLVDLLDAFSYSEGATVGLIEEHMDRGSLQDIVDNGGCQEEKILSSIARQCLLGLDQLHERNHIHRDMKPANILLNSNGVVKIADFGIAKFLSDYNGENGTDSSLGKKHASTFIGTMSYMSPERLIGKEYNDKSDIYSLGLSIMAAALGGVSTTSPGSNYWSVVSCIKEQGPPTIPLEDDRWSFEIRDFFNLCLNRDPDKRQGSKAMLGHAFIQKHIDYQIEVDHCRIPEKMTSEINQILHAITKHFERKKLKMKYDISFPPWDVSCLKYLAKQLHIEEHMVLQQYESFFGKIPKITNQSTCMTRKYTD